MKTREVYAGIQGASAMRQALREKGLQFTERPEQDGPIFIVMGKEKDLRLATAQADMFNGDLWDFDVASKDAETVVTVAQSVLMQQPLLVRTATHYATYRIRATEATIRRFEESLRSQTEYFYRGTLYEG